MSEYKRILTVQDISCVGQCSLTVALPILSACGVETAVLPSAVLSTHTGCLEGYTFRDLGDDMPGIAEHWEREGIRFDAVYSGYLGSAAQASLVRDISDRLLREGGVRIVDPAVADNGRLYSGITPELAESMRGLVADADYVLPNITEAAILCGIEYRERYGEDYVRALTGALLDLGARNVVLTGVGYDSEHIGVVTANRSGMSYYEHRRIGMLCHGTGDIFASVFSGLLLRGLSPDECAAAADEFVLHCIENTVGDEEHFYGVKFEPLLGELTDRVRGLD